MGLGRWWARCKRRKGGVYLWRTRKHAHPTRRENGYVGESVSFKNRARDHMGTGNYGQQAQPWSDLDPKMYQVIRLPWWLCWKWVLRPLETLVILATAPRYNYRKNRWNPRRVTLARARGQRLVRDAGGRTHRIQVRAYVWGRRAVQLCGIMAVLAGIVGAVVSR